MNIVTFIFGGKSKSLQHT